MRRTPAPHPHEPPRIARAAGGSVRAPLAVRPRPCQRPSCGASAAATLSYRYDSGEAWLAPLVAEPAPHAYDLCASHADRTRPPGGWSLRDLRVNP